MYDENDLVKSAEEKTPDKYKKQKDFFITIGEEPNYYDAIDEFIAIMEKQNPENFKLDYKKFKGETHATVPLISMYYGLEHIFSGYQLTIEVFREGLEAIDKHYADLTKQFGYEIKTPEQVINQLGYSYLVQDEFEMAIEIFSENTKRFPVSANVYDSLGEAYEKSGNIDQAEENYKMAVKLGEANNHPFLNVYKINLERVKSNFRKIEK